MDLPRRLVIPPCAFASEIMALRAHIDEAVTDPDYSVVLSYECRWDELPAGGPPDFSELVENKLLGPRKLR